MIINLSILHRFLNYYIVEFIICLCINIKFKKRIAKYLSKLNIYDTIILFVYGDVAQLARARGSYPRCRGFKSLRRYHMEICSDFPRFNK